MGRHISSMQTLEEIIRHSERLASLAFNLTNDHDIIARLDNVDNKTDYVRRLIRTDIAKETEE